MATAAVLHRKRPAPDDGGEVRRPAPEASDEKRARFDHETVKKADYCGSIDEDVYETVEEDYELDSIDDYEMLEDFDDGTSSSCCGAGGFARARDRCTGETVGVWRVRRRNPTEDDDGEASVCAAVREAACLAACRGHRSVLQLRTLAADETTGDLFIVTEPLSGGGAGGWSTLRSHLATRRRRRLPPFSEADARAFMKQLFGAAAAMHAAGVTHRDINPDTILVGGGPDGSAGALKISGFGCATKHAVGGDPPEPEPPMGSMRYRSPEQLYGGVARTGPEQDTWALGCVMAELLTGGAPLLTAETEEGLLEQAIDLRDDLVTVGVEAFDGVLELSVAGRELLAGLLEFDSWERPAAADALKHRWFTLKQRCSWFADDEVDDDVSKDRPESITRSAHHESSL